MRLLLFEPAVAARSCEDCKKWWFDDSWKGERFVFTTKILTMGGGNHGEPKKLERQPHAPTPCKYCPKKSPEEAERLKLTWKSLQAISFYHEVKACNGANLTPRMKRDGTLTNNLSIIDGLFRQHEQMAASSASLAMMSAMTAMGGLAGK